MNSASFRVPLLLLAVLLAAVAGGAAALFGFTDPRPVALPGWIWCGGPAGSGEACAVGTSFSLRTEVGDASMRVAASGPARVLVDGQPRGATGAKGDPAVVQLGTLAAGPHELRIEATHQAGDAGICAVLELPAAASDRARIVTDASWSVQGSAGSGMPTVTAAYDGGPWPGAFGPLDESASVPKPARFWTVLLLLMGAMTVACLAGPVLRPAGGTRRDTAAVNLAVIYPSVLYASAAFVITSLAATGMGTGVIVGMHVVAAALFALVLIAWKSGATVIDEDQVRHRAELSGYDAMCDAVEHLRLDLSEAPSGLRAELDGPLHELADAVRYGSTGTTTPEIDRRVIEGIEAVRAAIRSGGDSGSGGSVASAVRTLIGLVRERELRLQSARRG